MKRTMIIAVVLVLSIGCEVTVAGGDENDTGHLYAVLMYAEHCASCSMLDPTVRAVGPEFEEDITFLRFDMSDEATRTASKQLATEHQLEDLYRKHENRTGYLVVVSEDGEEELLRLSGRHQEAELRAEFEQLVQQDLR